MIKQTVVILQERRHSLFSAMNFRKCQENQIRTSRPFSHVSNSRRQLGQMITAGNTVCNLGYIVTYTGVFIKKRKKKQKMFIAKATHIDRTLDRTLIIQKCWCLTAKKKREKCLSSSSTCKCRNWVSKLLFCVGGAKHDVHLLDGRLKTD